MIAAAAVPSCFIFSVKDFFEPIIQLLHKTFIPLFHGHCFYCRAYSRIVFTFHHLSRKLFQCSVQIIPGENSSHGKSFGFTLQTKSQVARKLLLLTLTRVVQQPRGHYEST